MFLGGSPVVDESDDKKGTKCEDDPTHEVDKEGVEGGGVEDAVAEEPGYDIFVANLSEYDEDDEDVEQEYKHQASGVTYEKVSVLFYAIVGVVERHKHSMHTAGSEDDGDDESNAEQVAVTMAHDVNNGRLYGVVD